jgi:hypothetical protein
VFAETLQRWHMATAGLPHNDQARTTNKECSKQKYSSKTTKYGQKNCIMAWNWTQCHAEQIHFRILESLLLVGSTLDSGEVQKSSQ